MDNPNTFVVEKNMNCKECARRVRRKLQKIGGPDSVVTIFKEKNKATLSTTEDRVTVTRALDKFAKKNSAHWYKQRRQATSHSPIPEPVEFNAAVKCHLQEGEVLNCTFKKTKNDNEPIMLRDIPSSSDNANGYSGISSAPVPPPPHNYDYGYGYGYGPNYGYYTPPTYDHNYAPPYPYRYSATPIDDSPRHVCTIL